VNERDIDRLELILELIDHLERRTDSMPRAAFLADKDEVDLTAFRLAAVGEEANKLSSAVKARHPAIEWNEIYAMRNVIVHDYGKIDAIRVWKVLGANLTSLAAVCREELSQVTPAAAP